VIGVPAGLGRVLDRKTRFALLAVAATAFLLLPAAAFAADPATDQYSSNLTQLCIDGHLVNVDESGNVVGGAGGAAGGAGDVCGETGGGGGVASAGGGGTGGSSGGGGGTGSVGSLPFTGLDLAMMAAVAAALVGFGLALRRRRVAEAHE